MAVLEVALANLDQDDWRSTASGTNSGICNRIAAPFGLGVIVMVEDWADQGSLDTHARAPAFTALPGRFGELLAEPPVIEHLRRIG